MTLGKITFDNSVKYVKEIATKKVRKLKLSNQERERKDVSIPKKIKVKSFSQNSRKFCEAFAAGRSGILT